MDVVWRTLGIALAGMALLPAAASAASLHVVFPQTAETTVVQGQSTAFTLEVAAFGATSCDATTAPVRVNSLYSINAAGEVASGQPGDMPITTDLTRGTSDNCYIHTPVEVPLTATAAPGTPVGDYTTVVRYGKGGDGGVDLDGPQLTIHVIAAPELPAPVLAPPAIVVLGERAPAPHPTLGKTVLLSVVKDQVTYTTPGHSPVVLTEPTVVPNGTLIDPGSGVVKVTVARDSTGAEDTADVWGTSFRANQVVPNGGRALTTFALIDSPVTTGKAAHAARASRKRSLWVNAKGNFKTRGHRASAVVRGTYWVTTETDSTTKVSVSRGLVAVRDFVKKRTVLVPAGHTYTAKPRTHLARRPAFTGSVR